MRNYLGEMIDSVTNIFVLLLLAIPWLYGIVLAKGFWLVFISCIFPPYAWYLVVEKIAKFYGIA